MSVNIAERWLAMRLLCLLAAFSECYYAASTEYTAQEDDEDTKRDLLSATV